jgi:phthalate 4,5-dioxygenase
MLSREDNDLLTQTGPERPAGRLLRAYWQPVALVSEMPAQRPVKAVRVLGEDLVLFRPEGGGWALVGRFCAHRGVDLSFGRLEDGGLRCPLPRLAVRAGRAVPRAACRTPAQPVP